MEITLTYNFDETNYDYTVSVNWELLYDYFDYWDGALPKELLHLINFDVLEDDETFLTWLQTHFKDKARESFDEEYLERLTDCVEDLKYELDDNPPTSADSLMKYCVDAAIEASVKASDLFERLAFHYNLD